jgi:hypothetical protein
MKLIDSIGKLMERIKTISNTVDNSHSYRYVKLVAISDLGEDCRYARASEKLWKLDQRSTEIKLLEDLKKDIDSILEQLKQEETHE